jgi:phosphonate transport system ATP-binding protein
MLTIENVTVSYPNGALAIDAADAAFRAGELVALLGASGAGKSTLLRCMNGLIRPTRGDVKVGGLGSVFQSRRALREHRRRTGMVFQQHHLIGRQTALQNVLLGRLGHQSPARSFLPFSRADRVAALAALDRVGLIDRALERADRLSGGQQQRVGIARAMAQEPTILLADEPIASLDPAGAERVLSDLRRICKEDGITAIVSLHQVDFARSFADRVIGLSGGRIVFQRESSQLDAAALDRLYGSETDRAAVAAE